LRVSSPFPDCSTTVSEAAGAARETPPRVDHYSLQAAAEEGHETAAVYSGREALERIRPSGRTWRCSTSACRRWTAMSSRARAPRGLLVHLHTPANLRASADQLA